MAGRYKKITTSETSTKNIKPNTDHVMVACASRDRLPAMAGAKNPMRASVNLSNKLSVG